MDCPNCHTLNRDEYRFCTHCGTDLHPENGEVIIPRPPVKKGSHRVPVLILVILSAIGIALFFATADHSAPAVQSDTPWFSIHNGELYFDERKYSGGSEVTVPAQVNGESVLALGNGCFAGCTEITTVHLPDSLEAIGPYAFADCTGLRGIFIPESVTDIGDAAFWGCTELEAISVPGSVITIGSGAFENCDSLFYIFYAGSIDDWDALYAEFITPYTGVYCDEGSFYHGVIPEE